MNNLGISTAYFSSQISKNLIKWDNIKKELEKLELTAVELNPDIPIEWMKEIQQDVEKEKISVLSLHNFCPVVENIPEGKTGFNVFSLNSDDEEERKLAIKYTLRTIDYASQLSAKAIILHLGEIPTDPSGRELYKFILSFGVNSKLYSNYKNSLLKSRETNKKKYFSLLLKSIDKILPYAEQKKVLLCMETRFFPNEIPDFNEIEELLSLYKTKYFCYWHDFGHAEVLTRLGFVNGHKEYFVKYSSFLKGYHIHDVKGITDHFAPFSGEINFNELLIPDENKIFVLEVHSKENFNRLLNGIKNIKKILNSVSVHL